jgi:hypothetical protein
MSLQQDQHRQLLPLASAAARSPARPHPGCRFRAARGACDWRHAAPAAPRNRAKGSRLPPPPARPIHPLWRHAPCHRPPPAICGVRLRPAATCVARRTAAAPPASAWREPPPSVPTTPAGRRITPCTADGTARSDGPAVMESRAVPDRWEQDAVGAAPASARRQAAWPRSTASRFSRSGSVGFSCCMR